MTQLRAHVIQIATLACPPAVAGTIFLAREYSLSLYAGQLTKEKWEHAILPGASCATEVPSVELETNDSGSRWLVYWYAEMTFGPPGAAWELLLRLHHRSDSFGRAAEDGGSNTVCGGWRSRF